MLLGETGLFPVSVPAKCRMLLSWTGLTENSSDKISCKMYTILDDFRANDTFSSKWLDYIKTILIDSGYDCV